MQARPQPRKTLQHRLDLGRLEILAAGGAEAEVFGDRQLRKHLTAFGHQDQSGARDQMRGQLRQLDAAEADRARHGTNQAAQGLHQGRFAGAVGAKHRDGLAAADLQADAVEHAKRTIAGAKLAHIEHGRAGFRATPSVAPARCRRDRRP